MMASPEQFVQVQVEWAELAAVVTGGDLQHAWTARSPDAEARCFLDRSQINAIDDDLVDGPGVLRQFALDQAAQGGTVGIIGTGLQLLVAAADLRAAANDASRKRHDDPRHLANRGDPGL